ncbi:arginine--tRNA ligase [bacterium]|nr:arginine--tRNA ligase [bacterium]
MTQTNSITVQIENAIRDAIKTACDTDFTGEIRLTPPPKGKLGDFAFGCFPLAKVLRKAPPIIATEIAAHIHSGGIIAKAEAAGPYLNIYVNYDRLTQIVCRQILENASTFGNSTAYNGQKILIEYSAPNTNKPQHLGHVRNNLLGMAVTNLLDAVGYEAVPVNLVNDRGVHICKSMRAYQIFGENQTPESTGIKGDHFVGQFYVKYEQEQKKEWKTWVAAKDVDLTDLDDRERRRLEHEFLQESQMYQKTQKMLQQWEQGDPEVRALWEKMNSWVFAGFDTTYKRLGCKFAKIYKESNTYNLGKKLVLDGLEKGAFFQKEDGSVWIDLADQKLGQKLLLRRDGTSVYITQDIGTTKLKFDDFKPQKAMWVVADEQNHHFQVLIAVLKKLGFEWANGCYHLGYGMIDLPEGRMKSREGTVVDADNLMDELVEMEKTEIRERNVDIPESEFDKTAETLALGALKFFILKFVPQTRMTFNPRESISPLGFTGPYIQYAYVRVRSLFRKSTDYDFDSIDENDCEFNLLNSPAEKAIIRKLHDFPQEILAAAEAYNPSRVCNYLFELGKALNSFYHDHSVLKAETPELIKARLILSKAVAIVLERGLAILGIGVPERM